MLNMRYHNPFVTPHYIPNNVSHKPHTIIIIYIYNNIIYIRVYDMSMVATLRYFPFNLSSEQLTSLYYMHIYTTYVIIYETHIEN